MNALRSCCLALFLTCIFLPVCASHNLSGYFSYQQISGNTYNITLTTYTDVGAALVDRCTVDFDIMNNGTQITTLADIPRENGPVTDPKFPALTCNAVTGAKAGEYITGSIKKSVYIVQHTFGSNGIYHISFTDNARHDNAVNIQNSGQTPFRLSCEIRSNLNTAVNMSPTLLNHFVNNGCGNRPWSFNPGGFDLDGDSLVYKLTIPEGVANSQWTWPDNVNNANGGMTLDPESGDMIWHTPGVNGLYFLGFWVTEYRNGMKIGRIGCEIGFFINPCLAYPPFIDAGPKDKFVVPGDTLTIPFTVAPNGSDSMYVTLNNGGSELNGPFNFSINPPAEINFSNAAPGQHITSATDTVTGVITWAPQTTHIRDRFYQIDLTAHTDLGDSLGVNHAHKAIKVWVVSMPVDRAEPGEENMVVFPNPSGGHFRAVPGVRGLQAISAHLRDLRGREVWQAPTLPGGSAAWEFDCRDARLEPGIYLLEIETARGILRRKIRLQ